MRRRALNACGNMPSYAAVELRMTMEEWCVWAVPEYERFDIEHPDESPNAARRGDAGHYEIGNIEIVTQAENLAVQMARDPGRLQPDGTKRCSKCHSAKQAHEFSIRRSAGDGLNHWCRTCTSAHNKSKTRKPRKSRARKLDS